LQSKIQVLITEATVKNAAAGTEMKPLLDHLFNYMSLAIKLDMHAQNKNINFDKSAVEKV